MPTIYKPKKTKNTRNYKTEKREDREDIYQSARWKRLRQVKLEQNPVCECCLKRGRVADTEDIHHIISFVGVRNEEERYRLAYDIDNLLAVCKQCHAAIHAGVMDCEGNYLRESR